MVPKIVSTLIGGVGDKVGSVWSWLKDKVSGFFEGVGHTTSMAGNRKLGFDLMKAFSPNWAGGATGMNQWPALEELWTRESGWNHQADNPTSSAYGIPQALASLHNLPKGYYDRSTGSGASFHGYGGDPAVQIRWGLNYIKSTYGTPAAALAFHDRNNWYDSGGWLNPGTTVARNATGQPEAVLTAQQWAAISRLATRTMVRHGQRLDSPGGAHEGGGERQYSVNFNAPVYAHDPDALARKIHHRDRMALRIASGVGP
jgi:hypothetical protein